MEEKKKRKRKGGKKWVAAVLVLAAAGIGFYMFAENKQKAAVADARTGIQTATATRMDISSELTASSSLSPKNTYEVTSLVEGEVMEALFEEGDVVEKDQVLYRIDASSMDSELSSAETSLVRAQEKAVSAKEDYEEAVSRLSGNTYKSTATGYIKELYVSEGDRVSNGTKIAEIDDDSTMKLTVPFLSAEASQIANGSAAIVTLEDTGEQLPGTVTNVSSLEEVLSGGRLVKAVTVEVTNPGGLTTLTQATVSVGEFVCGTEGAFVPKTEKTMTADISGNGSLEIGNLLVSEGSHVTNGTAIFKATSESASDYIKNFEDNLETAEDNVKNAESKLSNTKDNIDNYVITAPISGTVITKNAKVGDKITKSSGGVSTLCVIYDLSAMTLEMSVDELDVRSVKVGQEVAITADAIEGERFSGSVTNVSLQSSYSNGVTNYPVTITMTETGDLLPGMNVDAEIILDKSEDALCIPVGALMRGNRVYVKDDSAESSGSSIGEKTERAAAGVPEGFTAVQVTTGITNENYVEILSGLSEGDEVYVDPSAGAETNMFQMGFPGGGMPGGNMGSGMPGGNMGGGAPGGNMGGNRGGGNMGARP